MIITTALIGYSSSGQTIEIPETTTVASLIVLIAIIGNIGYIVFQDKLYQLKTYTNTYNNKYNKLAYSMTKIMISIMILLILTIPSNNKFDISNRRVFGCELTNWSTFDNIQINIQIISIFILLIILVYFTYQNGHIQYILTSLVILFILVYTLNQPQFNAVYNPVDHEITVDSNSIVTDNEDSYVELNYLSILQYDKYTRTSKIIAPFTPYAFSGVINDEKIQKTKHDQIQNIFKLLKWPNNIEFHEKTNVPASFLMDNLFCVLYDLFGIYKNLIMICTKESYDKLTKDGFKLENSNARMLEIITRGYIYTIHNHQQDRLDNKIINKWPVEEDTLFKYISKIVVKIKNNEITIEEYIAFLNTINICIEDYLAYHSVSADNEKPPEKITEQISKYTDKALSKIYGQDIEIEIPKLKFKIAQ
jgi:hypothetical protein